MKRQSGTAVASTVVLDQRIEESREAMVRYARSRLGEHFSRSDAEDAVQAAFLEAWRDLPALRDPTALSAWLRRIVWKQCDRLRRARRVTMSVDAPGESKAEIPDPTLDPSFLITTAAENTVQQRQVRVAIHSLPPGERIAVLLYYWGGGSCHDLAVFLGISTTAFKSRLHSARRRLKERIATVETITSENAENLTLLTGSPEALTETERNDLLREVEAGYKRFTDAFEIQDPTIVMPLFTEDYELIFREERNEPIWDKARVERDVRRAGIQAPGRLRIRVIVDGLLSFERDPITGAIIQVMARATFLTTWANRPPHVRIDTFALVGTEWKFRRTLSLGEEK